MPRVCRQTRIIDFVNGRMLFQEGGDSPCACTMLSYPQMQGLNAPYQQPAVERSENSSACILKEFDLLSQLGVGCDHETGDEIAMATQVLGARMNHQVCTQQQRLLQGR